MEVGIVGTIKAKAKATPKKATLGSKVVKGVGAMIGGAKGGSRGGGKRRHHGVAYYQNAVLKERLKKKLLKLKYGGR